MRNFLANMRYFHIKLGQRNIQRKKQQEVDANTKASEIKRDRFYGTIHKPSMQINEKIPGRKRSDY